MLYVNYISIFKNLLLPLKKKDLKLEKKKTINKMGGERGRQTIMVKCCIGNR